MSGGDAAWSEDVTHDVFIQLMKNAESVDASKPLEGWLLTVTYRLCVDHLRRERGVWWRAREALVAHFATAEPTLGNPSEEPALAAQLEHSLKELPPRERTAIVMKYMEGQTQTLVARALGCSEGSVSKLIGRGLARLRTLGWEDADDANQ